MGRENSLPFVINDRILFFRRYMNMNHKKIVPGKGGEHYVPYSERSGEESVVYFTTINGDRESGF